MVLNVGDSVYKSSQPEYNRLDLKRSIIGTGTYS